jgi:type VI protein secretion system component VasF
LQTGEEKRQTLIDELHFELYPQTGQAMQALSPHGLPLGSIFKRKKAWSVWPFALIVVGVGIVIYVVLQFLQMNAEQDILNTLRSAL